jgi:hypothetical protein
MLLSTLITLTSLLAASASPVGSKPEDIDPNMVEVNAWLDDTSNTTTLVIGSRFYIKEPVDKLDKRDCIPRRWTTNNVDRTGTWWSSWEKVSGCNYNTKSSSTASYNFQTSQTVTKTVSGSFDAGIGSVDGIAKTINGNGGLSLGFSWSTSKTTGFEFTCNINPGDKASVWQQNLMGWADTAQRRCTSGCGEGEWCSDWQFGHIDFPLKGGSQTNQNLGCSSGADSHCP